MKEWIRTADDVASLCDHIAILLRTRRILLLEGDLGAGKTTFTKSLVNKLGSNDAVTSPSFSLINEYMSNFGVIYHMDMYRLTDIKEAFEIGVIEYLDSGNICIIEWPELIYDLIDHDCIKLKISIESDESRSYILET